jgi:hypothetical protein
MQYVWYNFGIVDFLFSAVYQYIHLTFLFILIVCWAQNINILGGLKRSSNKQNCIVDKSLKIFELIKNAVRLILDNFRIVGLVFFGRIPVDSPHFSLHLDSIFWAQNIFILIVFWDQNILFVLYGPTGGRQENVAYWRTIKYNFTCRRKCRKFYL